MKRLLVKSLTAVALVAGFVSCATAADVIWSGTTGSYTDATQWDGGAVPTAEDTAKIGSGATVSLTGSDEQNAKNVYVGYVENDSVAAQFLFSGLLRVNDTFLLGQTQGSAGAVEQTGGALTTVVGHDPSFSIGYQKDGGNGAVSTYKLSDGSITVTAGTGHVGSFGNGIFEMSGGTFTISSWFVLAWQAGSSGTMDLSGGTLTQTSAGQGLIIGEHGTASLTVRDNGVVENVGRLSMNGNSSITVKNGGRLTAAFLARQNNDGDNPVITLDGGTLTMTGTTKVRGDYFPAFTTTTIGTGGATLEIPKDYQATVAQPFGGSGGLTKTGQGTLTLTGDSTYTGPTRVREGALFLATPTTIPSLANLTLDAGTTLGVRSDAGWSMEAFTQTIIPKVLATPNANLGIDTTVQDVTYDMDLTFPNGGGLVKAGKNKLTL
ncbi:MAG: autotransporter-associated beta strand repeat-containing protein, partial [Kiritimatiellae bacterium]|nr:autotransporter-associated beta strand repeat-containing protein [Kiritimatiellia bacterium]